MSRTTLFLALVFVASLQTCRADEPAKDSQTFNAPPPNLVASQVLPYYLPPSLPRPGTREVWQYYGVNNRGRWVPRVILAPSGAYYYYSGAPYPFTTPRPGLYMPYVVD